MELSSFPPATQWPVSCVWPAGRVPRPSRGPATSRVRGLSLLLAWSLGHMPFGQVPLSMLGCCETVTHSNRYNYTAGVTRFGEPSQGRPGEEPAVTPTAWPFSSPVSGSLRLAFSTLLITTATSHLGCDLLSPALRHQSPWERSPSARDTLTPAPQVCSLPGSACRGFLSQSCLRPQPGSHLVLLLRDIAATMIPTLPCAIDGPSGRSFPVVEPRSPTPRTEAKPDCSPGCL